MDKGRVAGGVAAVLATGVILAPQLKQVGEGIYSGGAVVVREAEDIWNIPSDLSHDEADCFVGTNTSSHTGNAGDTVSINRAEDPTAKALNQDTIRIRRQNCATYVSFLEGVVEVGSPLTLLGAVLGGFAIKRRFPGRSHKSDQAGYSGH